MAIVTIRERDIDELPPVCMQCGARAEHTVKKSFSWHPPWISVTLFCGLLVYVILALVMTKRMLVRAPFCGLHRHHWVNRALLIWLPALALVIVGGITFFSIIDQPGPARADNPVAGAVCIACSVLAVAWLVLAVVVQLNTIRPTEITDRSITLTCVCDDFADAYDDYVDDLLSRRRSRPRRDDDDDFPERLRDDDDRGRRGPPPLPAPDEGIIEPRSSRHRAGDEDDDDGIQERRPR